ncbi:MAG: RNA polymerase sigma factor, partial [Firmicutes bacterium]|nr:RNA polymerase sigma factor [Bacillota bacterium]
MSETIASAEGEKTLLSDIYLQYRQQMYALAYSILNNTHDAEDAVQEALYKTARYIPGIRDVNSPKTKALVMTI